MISETDTGRCASKDTERLGLLQMVLESDTGRYANEDAGDLDG